MSATTSASLISVYSSALAYEADLVKAMLADERTDAGGLALLGALLGLTVNPAFYALSGAVGAGLMFSGITGSCAMARILKIMPWNRVPA